MGIIESLGITQPKTRTGLGAIGLSLGIILVAVGCVSLLSRAWIFSSVLIALGLLVFALSAIINTGKRRKCLGSGSF